MRSARPASPCSHEPESPSARVTGMRSCTSLTKAFGPVMIIVQDFNVSPLAPSLHSSHSPANVSAAELSRAVKYQACLPLGAFCLS